MRVLDVQPVTLEGEFVRLEPLSLDHAADLAEACDETVHEYFLGARPDGITPRDFEAYVSKRLASPNSVQFAVVDKASNKAIGATSYMDIRADQLGLEIGATWYGKAFRGTAINPESKLLLLKHAFEVLKCERVQLKTDSRNLQSAAAIAKLGAVKEGILRNHRYMPGGIMSGTTMFSIIPEEWPAVESNLRRRLNQQIK